MGQFEDLTGRVFDRLTVIERAENKNDRVYWKCKCCCDDKTICIVSRAELKRGSTRSCGCLQSELSSIRSTTHGKTGSRIYNIWIKMKMRCLNPNDHAYKGYGGRGIVVFKDWVESFESFYSWAINNGYNDNLSIDRKDNDGDYTPNNCRFVDAKTQCNNRRSNIVLTFNGKSHTIEEWSHIVGINGKTLRYRYHSGWPIEDILTKDIKTGQMLSYNGETHTVCEWSQIVGIKDTTLFNRINRYGWDIEKALTTRSKLRKNKGGMQ